MEEALVQLIRNAFENDATDVFLMEDEPPRIRREGEITPLHPGPVPRAALEEFCRDCGIDPNELHENDLSWQLPDSHRLRVNLYKSLGRIGAVMRPIRSEIPTLTQLGLPAELLETWIQRRYGLVLVTGPTGSGKSTTVAASLDWLNRSFARHIVTLEDPIEYLFRSERSHISQREVRQDTGSFATALRASLRQSPDIIFIGEIRDEETALTALHAAETGHLVVSTMHSSSVVETIERFSQLVQPGGDHALALMAGQLIGIITQQLLPRLGGGLIPALEYFQNEAVSRKWIVERRFGDLQDHLRKSGNPSNCSLLDYLVASTRQGFLDADVARSACPRPQDFDRAMRGIT
ncbi:MAG: Flp pilus assembly complex ATPase component TadA [Akkermansiaceae bacterium]|nr:Flp pilus assembly complex ATPase component TadA [Akkermansiaceae bacterium]MCP5542790.1 Flp pilus assembly complex ATPase component TadA [Akkermansiaceae bacterium]